MATHEALWSHSRTRMSFLAAMGIAPDAATADASFRRIGPPKGPHCWHWPSDNVWSWSKHWRMSGGCRSGRNRFSLKTGTAVEASNLGHQHRYGDRAKSSEAPA